MSDINEYQFNFDTPKADEYLTDEAIPENSETTPNPSMSFDNIEDIYNLSDLIVKVKEPHECEYDLLKRDQILFAFLLFFLF